MTVEDITLREIKDHKRTNTIWFHIYEIFKVFKSRIVIAKG